MTGNLLTSLRKYRPRENTDPLENFITEAFAWILNNHQDFGRFFLRRVTERLKCEHPEISDPLVWTTQENLGGKYPDMVCKIDNKAFIFEHKSWSHLHADQLNNYRSGASDKYGPGNFSLILITGGVHLHDQNPDLPLCWYDVYNWMEEWQAENKAENHFIFGDFKELLLHEGMGPPATISHEAILSYFPARSFRQNISQLVQRSYKRVDWKSLVKGTHYKKSVIDKRGSLYGEEYGRIGLSLLKGWYPGIFVGFMLDGLDHKVKPKKEESPDFSIILDFRAEFFDSYPKHSLYLNMVNQLSGQVSNLDGWDFHNHLERHESPNKWHPIHIRMPVLELFRGTLNSEEQDKAFDYQVKKVLSLIMDCQEFWELRDELRESMADEHQ